MKEPNVPTMQREDNELANESPKQQSRTPRQRASRVSWLATLASTAACALPLLLTGGLAAGVGALINVWIVVAVVVAAGVAGAGLLLRRRKQSTARDSVAGKPLPVLGAMRRDENV
jgi:hypothetical protein